MITIKANGKPKRVAETLKTMHFSRRFADRAEYFIVVMDWGNTITFEVYSEITWNYLESGKPYYSTIMFELKSTWGSITSYRPCWTTMQGTSERAAEFRLWDDRSKNLEKSILQEMGVI